MYKSFHIHLVLILLKQGSGLASVQCRSSGSQPCTEVTGQVLIKNIISTPAQEDPQPCPTMIS